jgi:predicted DNA-binding transcriptional regulator YafY
VLGVSANAPVPGVEQGALAALAKLDRLLPPRLRSQVASLRAATTSLVSPTEVIRSELLAQLAQACDNHQRAVFSYRPADGPVSERRVEPHRLVATARRWYLVAFDLDRQAWRTFRVDRASDLKVPGHTFEPRELADPARMVAEAITTNVYSHRAVVRVEAPAQQVARQVPVHIGMVSADGAGALVEFGADDFDWLVGYMVSLGLAFEVLEPPELRRHVASLGAHLAATHTAEA